VALSLLFATPNVESLPLISKLCPVSVFLSYIILHGKTSEVTLLRSLFYEVKHHRRPSGLIVVVIGRVLVIRLVCPEVRSRVAMTVIEGSISMMTAAGNAEIGKLTPS
jgi:hypothetical protein